ncbi:MAG: class 1 fructose-bisphosphatase [Bacteroidota bacterium]
MHKSKLGLPIGTTLDRFIKLKEDEIEFATGELSQLLRDIALAGKIINREVNKAGLLDIAGGFGEKNVQGEDQQKLDVIADIRFTRALKNGGMTCAIISEENSEITHLNPNCRYVVAIDPLDGSSNIDVNVSIGTIFSIYKRVSPVGGTVQEEDILQKGTEQVAAGYILYGSSTMLVYTTGFGVYGFTLEPSLGEFVLSHDSMECPTDGMIFSINEGNYYNFHPGMRAYIEDCKQKGMSARYIGSLVADFHRNMLKGGVYLYPNTHKDPKGKLRLLYECNALAFIAEQSGGLATDGKQRILEIQPTSFHQRSPLYLGSANLVKRAIQFIEDEEYSSQSTEIHE